MRKSFLIVLASLFCSAFISCNKDRLEESITTEEKNANETTTNAKSAIPESCYTLKAKFIKHFFTLEEESIRLKTTIYFGGFGPGLELKEQIIRNGQTVKLTIPKQFRNSYQFSSRDRFRFETNKISSNGNLFFRDELQVKQLGGTNTSFFLPLDTGVRVAGPVILPYMSLDIEDCL